MKSAYTKNIFLILFAALALILSSCGGESDVPASGSSSNATITYALQTGWSTLVPFDFSGSGGYYGQLVWDKIYDKLVYVRSNGEYAPRAAKTWTISDDKKVYTFQLDPQALWQDGEKVTAADWVFTAQLLSNKDFVVADGPAFAVLIDGTDDNGIESSDKSINVKALDDYTLQITFKAAMSADSFFMTYQHYFSVLPQHILGSLAPSEVLSSDYWSHPIGSGPAKFVSEISNNEITFEPFAEYHLGAPKFGKLIMKVLSGSNFASSFMTHEIDFAYPPMGTEEAQSLEGFEGIDVGPAEYATDLWFIAFNNKLMPDARVKKALNLAIDKQLIVEQLFLGKAEAVESVQIPKGKWYDESLKGGRDLARAKELLDEAGWDYNTELTLATPSGTRLLIANILQQNFAEIGVKLKVESMDIGAMFGGMNQGLYPMCLVGGNASFDPLWINSNLDYRKRSFFNVSDPKYVELADAITRAPDEASQMQLVKEYQEYMAQNLPLVPIVMQYPYAVKASRLQNMSPFDPAHSNDSIWEWTIVE